MKIQMTHWPVEFLIKMLQELPDDAFVCHVDLTVERMRDSIPDCMVVPTNPPSPDEDIPF